MTHTCRAIGCKHQVTDGKLMCLPHWRMVPPALQDDVIAQFKAWGRALRAKDYTLAMQRARAYSAVVDQAKTAVHAAEQPEDTEPATGDLFGGAT